MRDSELLSTARPCPFCGSAVVILTRGVVQCDECLSEGPFAGKHFDAKVDEAELLRLKRTALILWNGRAA